MINLWRASGDLFGELIADKPGGPINPEPRIIRRRSILTTNEFGDQILAALGINPATRVRRIQFDLQPGNIATVEVTIEVDKKSGPLVGTVFETRRFEERLDNEEKPDA